MTDLSRISKGMYWDRAWSLVSGCTHVSPGCDNCWSEEETHMRASNPNEKVKARNQGLTEKGCFNGQIRLNHDFLDKPLRVKKPTVWAVWNDLFHEDVPNEFIYKAFAVMAEANWHTFLILTKRPERMREAVEKIWFMLVGNVFNGSMVNGPLPNVWLGVTSDNQEMADKRIPILLQTPAAVRFVSVEPMLGPVDLDNYYEQWQCPGCGSWESDNRFCCTCGSDRWDFDDIERRGLDWVICGGESGSRARPMHPDWAESLRDQCQAAGVLFFFKQWGEWAPVEPDWFNGDDRAMNAKGLLLNIGNHGQIETPNNKFIWLKRIGKKKSGRVLDGREWNEIPNA